MKRVLSLLLGLVTLFSLGSCAAEKEVTSTGAPSEDEAPSQVAKPAVTVEDTTDFDKIEYEKVDVPLTPERVAAIPIANNTMTSDELRQICVDYVKLSVSFQWVPNADFSYDVNQIKDDQVYFKEGVLYGGIPYINTASGNLYRMLEFYDVETGILNVKWLKSNTKIFGTACSGTTGWGWSRVINSAVTGWTHSLNASHGLIPVGPYTYDLSTTAYGTDGFEDCKDIAKRNGEQTMYESYAQSLKADCFVNNGHVRMNGENPVVVRNADGTIDGEKSYIVQVEQGLFTSGEYHDRVTSDGIPYEIQGNEGCYADGSPYYYTFKKLFETGYLPHTFKEFHGQDPVEPGSATLGIEKDTVTAAELLNARFEANYTISDIITTLTDSTGKVIFRNVGRTQNHFTRSVAFKDYVPGAYLNSIQKKEGITIEVTCQLGNGEVVAVYKGSLSAS